MNIVAVADAFIPQPVMAEALSLLEPSKLVVLQWSSEDVADLHRRVRRIERLGPTAESPPDAIGDYVQDVELLVTHMCPVDAELIRQSPKLSMVFVEQEPKTWIVMSPRHAAGVAAIDGNHQR
tara:strand:- start:329 stop:697 length:369 start_codon:yes stop_codon:yes gene_type:complete